MSARCRLGFVFGSAVLVAGLAVAAALGSGFGGASLPAKAVIPGVRGAGFPVVAATIPTGYTVVSSGSVDNPSGAQTQGMVFCPAGTVVWSGGALGEWG